MLILFSTEFIRDALSDPASNGSGGTAGCPRTTNDKAKSIVGVVGPGSSAVTIQVRM